MMTVNPCDSPPVVFISQIGTGGASWNPVIDLLATGSTTVTYDRPGTGSAPPRAAPNPPLRYSAFADELASLLDQQRITEPVVLVGHSFGSPIARIFADRHRARVVGVVHVDGSIPRVALWPPLDWPPSPDGDGPDATIVDRILGEVEILEAHVLQKPTAVITRTPGRRYLDEPPEIDTLWTAHQRLLARQTSAPLIVADNASHQIPREAPALVAHVVDAIVAAVRTETRWTPNAEVLAAVGGALDPEVPATPSQRRPRPASPAVGH